MGFNSWLGVHLAFAGIFGVLTIFVAARLGQLIRAWYRCRDSDAKNTTISLAVTHSLVLLQSTFRVVLLILASKAFADFTTRSIPTPSLVFLLSMFPVPSSWITLYVIFSWMASLHNDEHGPLKRYKVVLISLSALVAVVTWVMFGVIHYTSNVSAKVGAAAIGLILGQSITNGSLVYGLRLSCELEHGLVGQRADLARRLKLFSIVLSIASGVYCVLDTCYNILKSEQHDSLKASEWVPPPCASLEQ